MQSRKIATRRDEEQSGFLKSHLKGGSLDGVGSSQRRTPASQVVRPPPLPNRQSRAKGKGRLSPAAYLRTGSIIILHCFQNPSRNPVPTSEHTTPSVYRVAKSVIWPRTKQMAPMRESAKPQTRLCECIARGWGENSVVYPSPDRCQFE